MSDFWNGKLKQYRRSVNDNSEPFKSDPDWVAVIGPPSGPTQRLVNPRYLKDGVDGQPMEMTSLEKAAVDKADADRIAKSQAIAAYDAKVLEQMRRDADAKIVESAPEGWVP